MQSREENSFKQPAGRNRACFGQNLHDLKENARKINLDGRRKETGGGICAV